jgi:predicted amidohydrolase YtcJ
LARTLDVLVEHGVAAVFDAGGTEETFAAVAALERANRLHLYYEGSVHFKSLAELPARLAVLQDWQRKYGSRHLRINTVKFFLDGTNEINTSALLEPFANMPQYSGELRMSKEDLVSSLKVLNKAGVDIHIHMTGDRAFRVALDAVEDVRRELGTAWRIQVTFAHCDLIADSDFVRVAPLGVFVNFTPHWAGNSIQGAQETVGMERYNNMHRFQPIISSGGNMTFGSDTVSLYEWQRANPFVGIEIGHTRLDSDPRYRVYGMRKPASEMLQIRDLVKGYSITGARQLRLETLLGSIAPGKLANFVIVDRNILDVPSVEIHQTKSIAVVFEGQVVKGEMP